MTFCARPLCENPTWHRPDWPEHRAVFCANCWAMIPEPIRARFRGALWQPRPLAALGLALTAALEALRKAGQR